MKLFNLKYCLLAPFLVGLFIVMHPEISTAQKAKKLEKLMEKQEYTKVIEAGEKYIRKKPDAPDAELVKSIVMRAEYELSKKANTLASYKAFEMKYPNNPFHSELMERKSIIYYNTITKPDGSLEAYRNFIKMFPNSSKVQEALKHEHNLAWERAREINTVAAYNQFRNQYPESPKIEEALDIEYELAWILAENENNVNSWRRYYTTYPNSPKASDAKQREIELAWANVVSTHTAKEYEEFFTEYPDYEKYIKARPKEPTNLKIVDLSKNEVHLSWEDNSHIEDRFKLERKESQEYRILFSTTEGKTEYIDKDIKLGKTYFYRVSSCRNNLCSEHSNEIVVSAKTPSRPESLVAYLQTDTMVELVWQDQSDNESHFEIIRKDKKTKKKVIFKVEANNNHYIDTNVEYNHSYYYTVRAANYTIFSGSSDTIQVKIESIGSSSTSQQGDRDRRPSTACAGKLKWGYSKSQVKRHYRSMKCEPTKNRETFCGQYGGTFAGESVLIMGFMFYNYRLVMVIIEFVGDPSDELYDLLVSKYGDPDEKDSYSAKWIIGDSSIVLSWEDDITLVYFHTEKAKEFFDRRQKRALRDL